MNPSGKGLASGIRLGHWTGTGTGVTVILCPEGTVCSCEIRGGAPATRETALLDPTRSVARVDAVVLTGGSAFGLAAADGVMAWLAEQDRGFPTRGGVVPIVPTAAIYDLADGVSRPGPADGRAAAEAAAHATDTSSGRVGAGTGATIGKWRGADYVVPGGLGLASAAGDAHVDVVAVVNAVGDVIDADGSVLAGSTAPADAPAFPASSEPFELDEGTHEATTLVVVATDAPLSKLECHLVAQSGHHGLARAIRPSHTRHDGDLVVALATTTRADTDATATGDPFSLDRLRVTVTDLVAEAVRNAVRQT